MALPKHPIRIPFTFGGFQYPTDMRPQGTFVLPKRIPFTISALPAVEEVPYGAVGWEVVVKSHEDFESIILRTSNYSGLLFSDEEDAVGGGSVTFDLSNEIFQGLLLNGRPASDLYEHENLWEAHFDGVLRATWLGTNIKETQLQDSESTQVTISGPGPAQVLEWASVLPAKFPIVTPKLESLQDLMSGELVDTTIWNLARGNGLAIARGGGREEAQNQIDVYNEALILAQADKTSAQEAVTTANNYYKSIVKSNSYTAAEKKAAQKAVNSAKDTLALRTAKVTTLQTSITKATAWRNTYPTPSEPNQTPSIKLRVPSADAGMTLGAGPFDFVSSGIAAWVDPLPQTTSSTGQATTEFSVESSTVEYARIFTQLISGHRRLVAEVRNLNDFSRQDWEYDPKIHKFWRIRERLGEVIFETSADSLIWTEHFVASYSWDASSVDFWFRARIEGNVGVNPPLSAFIGAVNQSALPSSEPLFVQYRRYLDQAQARGVIPYVSTTWTPLTDSAGASWSGFPDAAVEEGVDLFKMVQSFSDAQQASWHMKPDFTLEIRQKTWVEGEPDPTQQFHREGTVVFHETGSQLFRERTRTREDIANYVVGKNAAGDYAVTQDEESMAKFQRRELYISAGQTTSLEATAGLISSTLETVKDEKNSWRIKVDPDQPGRRVFLDYGVGDWIGIENPETGNIDSWKVVGIAISVGEEGDTDLELTLQSRLELLAERLKFQIEKLGGSSSAAGIAISNPVTAATLIQQAKLSSLLDVTIGVPEDGDVLTYNKNGGFWYPSAPGDKTVPDVPVITDTYTSVYQSAEDIWTKAQVQISWTTPLNIDGSTITDGHHYEVRFRPDTTSPYAATWEEASQLTWAELETWAQPTIPPISNIGWQTNYVGFDENTTIVQELTPGVRYEFQVRAVDSSTPQHWSDWSDSVLLTAARDTIAPPTPAPPLVASSRLAIQVTHSLGRFTGGTFNLPEDMDHLEVHVGGPEFFPSEETRVGKIPANLSMMRGRIPAIGTIQIENVDDVWVSVVAVDRTGNRSAGSPPIQASVNLIDDAHISDLTATKITAGTISSAIILAGIIQTAESGARAEMDSEGFRIYTDDGDPTVSLVGSPGLTGNFLLIKDPEDSTKTLAGIDGSGRGSFQNLYVADDITLGGASLLHDILEPKSKGVIALGAYTGDPVIAGGPSVERGFMEISFIAEESRSYMITAMTEWESTAANDRLVMRLRDCGDSEPSLALPWIQQAIAVGATGAGGNAAALINFAGTFTPGLHRILLSFYCGSGVASVQAPGNSGVESTSLIWVEDIGLPVTDTMLINDAGVPEYNAPAPPADKPASSSPKPKPKVTYTKNYSATWSGTFRSNGAYSSSHGATMVQGNSGDGYLGDARGLVGFNSSQIRKDLAGATIKSCHITLYANHWWENNGGTARIGTHDYTNRPSSISSGHLDTQRVSSGGWPKPGKRKVSLGTTIGNEFKSGASKGIMVGPTNDSHDQYGRFNGNGQSNEPVLTIVYVK
jgi:hypothetical protein